MSPSPRPQLTHVGIYAQDLPAMEAFYTQVLGLIVADRGCGITFKSDFVFMTAQPGTHHQLILVSGRAERGVSTVNQISFRVGDLDALKELHRRLVAAGAANIRPVDHGNALSVYLDDPEGNGVELYLDTPWHVPQPHAAALDLSLPNETILARTEQRCRATPGFLPMAAYAAEIAAKLQSPPNQSETP